MEYLELKPCPFCGGEATVRVDLAAPKTVNGRLRVGCDTVGCRGFFHASCKYYESPDEAIESWNTRVERTCHDTWDIELTGRLRFKCSECGAVSLEATPNFCPVCGSRVVWEVDADGQG